MNNSITPTLLYTDTVTLLCGNLSHMVFKYFTVTEVTEVSPAAVTNGNYCAYNQVSSSKCRT